MGYLRSFLYEFRNTYTVDDRLITLLFASIFLPWQLCVVAIVLGMLYILIKSDFIESVKQIPFSKVLLLFALYLLVVSLLNSNWLNRVIDCM